MKLRLKDRWDWVKKKLNSCFVQKSEVSINSKDELIALTQDKKETPLILEYLEEQKLKYAKEAEFDRNWTLGVRILTGICLLPYILSFFPIIEQVYSICLILLSGPGILLFLIVNNADKGWDSDYGGDELRKR